MTHYFCVEVAEEVGMEAAVLLENIFFWCEKNRANGKLQNGKPFTYNSVKAFNLLFPYISASTISRALKRLEAEGFIEVGEFNKDPYNHTKWYCTTDKAISFYRQKAEDKPQADSNTDENSDFQNSESICQNEKSNKQNDNSIRESGYSDSSKQQILHTDNNPDSNPNNNPDNKSQICAGAEKDEPALPDYKNEPLEPLPENPGKKENPSLACFGTQMRFAQAVYEIWEKADLPKPKSGYSGFLMSDFKIGLDYIHQQNLNSGEVMQACRNYVSVVMLMKDGGTWWTYLYTFDVFAKPNVIRRFLPEHFDIRIYKSNGAVDQRSNTQPKVDLSGKYDMGDLIGA